MAYATIDDIFARYAPIHTMVGTGTQDVTSLEVSSIFIADAESFMNTFLAKRYQTPVATEPVSHAFLGWTISGHPGAEQLR